MTASLSILNHPPSTALASSSTPKSEEVEDFNCCLTLFLENIERLEQERKDHEESEHLMREMREDLARRIHDQQIASDSRTEAHTSENTYRYRVISGAENTYRYRVDYGKTYLLRVINNVMNEEQFFGIAGHSLTVVGQDAAYIKPITSNYIMITPGQTMDILVSANQTPSEYYMASISFSDGTQVPYDNTMTTAILQYNGNYPTPSAIPLPLLPGVNDSASAESFTGRVRSLASENHPINVPQSIDRRLYITVALNYLPCTAATCAQSTRDAASMNNVSFEAKPIDILQAYYRSIDGVFDRDFPSEPPKYYNFTGDNMTGIDITAAAGTKVKMLNYGESVEIVFQGTNLRAGMNHPIHLHGFSFYLVGTGKGNFNNVTDPRSYNLIDPPEINTVALPKSGWAAIRFIADNPGVWFIHCHLERHSSWGMDTVLIVRNGRTRATSMRPPPASLPSCS